MIKYTQVLPCVVVICGSEEKGHDPVVFATVAETITPLESARGLIGLLLLSFNFVQVEND